MTLLNAGVPNLRFQIEATDPCETKRVASDPQIDKQFLDCL
jgi:hypothetical protein